MENPFDDLKKRRIQKELKGEELRHRAEKLDATVRDVLSQFYEAAYGNNTKPSIQRTDGIDRIDWHLSLDLSRLYSLGLENKPTSHILTVTLREDYFEVYRPWHDLVRTKSCAMEELIQCLVETSP